jgi:S-adenosylmethionine:tRNA ribosyltransferase-isomerase
MKLDLFHYDLPEKFIAQQPLERRDQSKLLILEKKTGRIKHDFFYNIKNYLNKGDILVLNESKVSKCRLIGFKEKTGAKIECLVLKKISRNHFASNKYLTLLKPSKRIKQNDRVAIGGYFFEVEERLDCGKAIVKFSSKLDEIIEKYGKVPLPPYIKKDDIKEERYQTVYAGVKGSAAAPTAGFHFTRKLIDELKKNGIKFAKLRLDIGLDTFRPIVEEEIEEHIIHSEHFFLSGFQAKKIITAREIGGRVIAVGTTSTRVLETVMTEQSILKESKDDTNLYIYPGYRFKIVDAMITNFHLPYSTLLVMVSAFAGRENILMAYEEAKKKNYRFYSFGDCMFIY